MTVITWQMQERFSFPNELGVPEKMTAVRITPQWHAEELEESIRLTGIYHIAAQVAFTDGDVQANDGVFIDELDVGEIDSYFEYALPLEIDLAKDKKRGDVLLHVADITSVVEDGQTIVMWQMNCSYEEVAEQLVAEEIVEIPVEEEVMFEQETPIDEEIVFEQVPAVHEEDFYKELAEAYTVFQSNLNKVRRQ